MNKREQLVSDFLAEYSDVPLEEYIEALEDTISDLESALAGAKDDLANREGKS